MRILRRLLIFVLCASLLFISTGCIKKDKSDEVNDSGTPNNTEVTPQKYLILDTVLERLNNEPDMNLLKEKFKKIVIIQEPLENLEDYEGSYKTTDGNLQSTAYGIEGIYRVSENTDLHIRLIYDDTQRNGGYISDIQSNTAETSIFKYKYFFIIFNVIVDNTDTLDITYDKKEVNNFKKNFYNLLKNTDL